MRRLGADDPYRYEYSDDSVRGFDRTTGKLGVEYLKSRANGGFGEVRYYDANKTGALVNRIMTDVEGVRNLIGTGLVEFAGLSHDVARAKQTIPPALRKKVSARDGHRCAVPGCRSTNLDAHHILEVSKGGKHELSNLLTLCERCHPVVEHEKSVF